MNKVYRSIWNKALGAFVAASELDRSCGKGRSGAGATVCDGRSDQRDGLGASTLHGPDSRVLTVLLLMGLGGWGAQAQAQVSCATAPFNFYSGSTTCVGFQSTASGGGATAVGYAATSTGLNALSLGFQAIASVTNATYVGARTAAGTGATAESAIGIGTDVTASGSA